MRYQDQKLFTLFLEYLFYVAFFLYSATTFSNPVDDHISLETEFEHLSGEIFSNLNIDGVWLGNSHYTECVHYLKVSMWEKCLPILDKEYTDLDENSAQFRNLLYGITYQSSTEYQRAFNYYYLVPANSMYYVHANLNIALLHVQLERPNKAVRIINNMISNEALNLSPEMLYRLYLTQGYILLLANDFKQSRASLEKVAVNSQYINQAVSALSLGYIYSGDFDKAKKYLSYLTRQSLKDISADTSHALLAFAHSQEQNYSPATLSAYRSAIQYYKKRISEIDTLLANSTLPLISAYASDHLFIVDNTILNLSNRLPETFLANFTTLDTLSHQLEAKSSKQAVFRSALKLYQKYDHAVNIEARNQLLARKASLYTYLKQCSYTLARILYQNKQ